MGLETLIRWVRGDVRPADPSDQAVARQAYADYLRAQIAGFAPADADALLEKLTVGPLGEPAPFPDLMGVELRLVDALSDDLIERSYWIVRERFNRVAGAAAIAEHLAWSPVSLSETATVSDVPPPPEPKPDDAPAVVDAATLASDAATRESELRRDHAAEIAGTAIPGAAGGGQSGVAPKPDAPGAPPPAAIPTPEATPPTTAADPAGPLAAPPEKP